MDCYSLGKFAKKLSSNIDTEVEETKKFFTQLREVAPDARIVWIYGNHEYRLLRHLMDMSTNLYKFLKLEIMTETEKFGIEVVDSGLKESFYQYGDLMIGHFDKVNKHSAYTAKALLDDKGMSLIQGHTHRVGTHIKRLVDGSFQGAWENGCLCNLKQDYVNTPNWCHGFSVVYKEGNKVDVVQIPIIDYKFFFGKRYE